jgi:hypothetical protein
LWFNRRLVPDARNQRLGASRIQAALLLLVLATALVTLPSTLRSDVDGMRADGRLSATAASEARGPDARAGTNIALIRAARARMPRGASFALVRGGRFGSDAHPAHALAFVWEAGQSWTQFALAPRLEVAPGRAGWLLIRDATPASAGVRDPLHAWRFGHDWLVEQRT